MKNSSSQGWATSFLYTQVLDTQDMQFTIICQGIPVGSKVGISSVQVDQNGNAPVPPILLNPATVTNEKTYTVGIVSKVPNGYSGNITYSLTGDTPFPDGSSVTCQVSYIQPSTNEIGGPVRLIVLKQLTTENGGDNQ